jgi:hypothetical protein
VTSIERTAYPRFPRLMSAREPHVFYTPALEEIEWASEATGSDGSLLDLVLALKCFARMGRFPKADEVPEVVVDHVRRCLALGTRAKHFGGGSMLCPTGVHPNPTQRRRLPWARGPPPPQCAALRLPPAGRWPVRRTSPQRTGLQVDQFGGGVLGQGRGRRDFDPGDEQRWLVELVFRTPNKKDLGIG